jgi:peptidoglycan hydrolase-like protein with peptidoglycan-binding domain
MRGITTGLWVVFFGVALAGCATMRPSAELETRVGALENRVGVLEADSQSAAPRVPETGFNMGDSAGVDIQDMTKKDIQKALKNAGYYDGAIDGKIGPKTRAAIKAFQGDKGLKEDGIPGSQTKEKRAKYLP